MLPLSFEAACSRGGMLWRLGRNGTQNTTYRSKRISTAVHAQEHTRCHTLELDLAHVHGCPLQDCWKEEEGKVCLIYQTIVAKYQILSKEIKSVSQSYSWVSDLKRLINSKKYNINYNFMAILVIFRLNGPGHNKRRAGPNRLRKQKTCDDTTTKWMGIRPDPHTTKSS